MGVGVGGGVGRGQRTTTARVARAVALALESQNERICLQQRIKTTYKQTIVFGQQSLSLSHKKQEFS